MGTQKLLETLKSLKKQSLQQVKQVFDCLWFFPRGVRFQLMETYKVHFSSSGQTGWFKMLMRHRVSSSKKKTKEKAEWNAVSNGDLPMETVLIL